ncbi:hypothetical protein AK812_SmicGene37583 [Symbiodinium microadriaticum]|uniref:Uncharacterized protein n=1 Tax=Symbiodinium microadriaticum TaxID=2951 RepID=A0A1Q9CFX2_SYMMI|nr:hypothetical protein AK812_SmicGene37583 [Symbiodinium microadriaticum]
MSEFAQQPEPNLAKLPGGGGGSLPVRPEHLRSASPREVAAATAKRTGDTASATPRVTPKANYSTELSECIPSAFHGAFALQCERIADNRLFVCSAERTAEVCTARREIQQARALAAGVKKKPVEESVSQVRGSHLLQQAQAAAKEQAQLQRKEWIAAVKRTQDSTAKFIAQKRMAASSTNSAASEAHQRAQLIRIAQDDNFWLENIRSFEAWNCCEMRTDKNRHRSVLLVLDCSAIGPAGDKIIGEGLS